MRLTEAQVLFGLIFAHVCSNLQRSVRFMRHGMHSCPERGSQPGAALILGLLLLTPCTQIPLSINLLPEGSSNAAAFPTGECGSAWKCGPQA